MTLFCCLKPWRPGLPLQEKRGELQNFKWVWELILLSLERVLNDEQLLEGTLLDSSYRLAATRANWYANINMV